MFQLCENLESENIAKTFRTTKQHDKDALVIEGEKRQEFEKWRFLAKNKLVPSQIDIFGNQNISFCS